MKSVDGAPTWFLGSKRSGNTECAFGSDGVGCGWRWCCLAIATSPWRAMADEATEGREEEKGRSLEKALRRLFLGCLKACHRVAGWSLQILLRLRADWKKETPCC